MPALYIEPLITSDKILRAYSESGMNRGDYGYIVQFLSYAPNSSERKLVEKSLNKLVGDKYLKVDGHHSDHYDITGDGIVFIQHGGYEKKIESENRKEEIIEAIQQSGLKTDNNIQETNVSIYSLNKVLKPATIVQAITAFVMLIVAGITLWVAYLSYKESKAKDEIILRLKSLEEEQGKTKLHIEKMQLPLGKDSTGN